MSGNHKKRCIRNIHNWEKMERRIRNIRRKSVLRGGRQKRLCLENTGPSPGPSQSYLWIILLQCPLSVYFKSISSYFKLLFKMIKLILNFWLCWVFIAACGLFQLWQILYQLLSCVQLLSTPRTVAQAASGGYSNFLVSNPTPLFLEPCPIFSIFYLHSP